MILKIKTIGKGVEIVKLFDSTKKKVVAGVTAFVLVSGVGISFAATDIGGQLKAWYDGVFDDAVAKGVGEAEQYGQDQLPGLEAEYNNLKDDAEKDINEKRDSETERAINEVEAAKNSHLIDLEEARNTLLNEAGAKFESVFDEGVSEIERLAGLAETHATDELTRVTSENGDSAVNHVNSELDQAKNDAVDELEEKIETAKNALLAQLIAESGRLTDGLQSEIDNAIEDIREEVTYLLVDLVEEQETAIANAASAKEQEAKDALDDVVANMNN